MRFFLATNRAAGRMSLALTGAVLIAVAVVATVWASRAAWDRPELPLESISEPTVQSSDQSRDSGEFFALGWPRLHGPTGHSTSTETACRASWPESGPPIIWAREVGTGYSAPVVTEEGLLLQHRVANVERLECLNPQTGEERWVCEYPTAYKCKYRYSSGPYSTPNISEGRAYAQSAEGALRCLDLKTGQIFWKRELSREFSVPEADWGVGHSPCVSQGRVFLNLGGQPEAGVIAMEASTGKTLWTATGYRSSYATPVAATIHGVEHLFVFNAEGCVSLDPRDGRERWLVKFGIGRRTGSANAVTPLVSNDLLLLSAGPGPGSLCLRVLPSGECEEVWRERRALDSQFNNQVLLNGHVYGFTSKWQGESRFVCLELKSGRTCWTWRSESGTDLGRGASLGVNGTLILLGETGHLAAIDSDPSQAVVRAITSKPLLEAPCYSAPALHGGLLYVRNERKLFCLSLR